MKFGISFKPMLLEEVDTPFNSNLYLYELKYDGQRAIIHVSPNIIKIFSRNGIDITYLYPELQNIKKIIKRKMILDGEIVLFYQGKPNFTKLQERSHTKNIHKINYYAQNMPVCFMGFDCLYDELDITNKTLLERKKILNKIKDTDYFFKVNFIMKEGKKLFAKVKKIGLEGIVAKRIDSLYIINSRSDNWLKIKNLKDGTFYIGGYLNKQHMICLYLGEFRNNLLYFVGKVMLGKKQGLYKKILKEKIRKTTSFCDYEDLECNYINPVLTCEISYLERTKSNKLRHPIFRK